MHQMMNSEYPPLLSAGIHDFSVEELYNVLVSPFQSNRRPYLYQRLKMFFKCLQETGISYEIWIDGSFCEDKLDPEDIDIVVFATPEAANSLSSDNQEILRDLFITNRTETKQRFSCDVYFCYSTNQERRSYWRGWFGFTRTETPKGFARVII